MADEAKASITAEAKKVAPALDHQVVAEAGDTELLGMCRSFGINALC